MSMQAESILRHDIKRSSGNLAICEVDEGAAGKEELIGLLQIVVKAERVK